MPDLEVPSAAWCAWVQARRTCPDRQWPRAGRTLSMAGVKQVRQPCSDMQWVFKLWRPRRRHLICTCSGGLSSGERPRASRAPEQSHLSSYEGARLRHPPRRRAARVTDMALRGVSTGGSALGSSHAVGGAESGLCVGGRGARLHRLPGGGGGHLRGSSEGARPPWGLELVPKPPPGASCRLLTDASSCSQAPLRASRRPPSAAARRTGSRAWPLPPPPTTRASPASAEGARLALRPSLRPAHWRV